MYVEHNEFIVIKIKYETWIAKQFIATYVRNLNYKTTCFGLWRPYQVKIRVSWRGRWVSVVNVIELATQTHLPLQDNRILTWWWPPEAETCRLIIKILYISCNKLFSNSCLVFNLNYYQFVVLEVHTLLFSILISTTGMIHLNNCFLLYIINISNRKWVQTLLGGVAGWGLKDVVMRV